MTSLSLAAYKDGFADKFLLENVVFSKKLISIGLGFNPSL
jgi:hypothetical protein